MTVIGGPGGTSPADALAELRSGRIQDPHERLRVAAKMMEGTFYQELFKVMRGTVPDGGAVSAGSGKEMFDGLFDQHIADAAAMQSDRGLGSALYRYLAQALPAEAGGNGGADAP